MTIQICTPNNPVGTTEALSTERQIVFDAKEAVHVAWLAEYDANAYARDRAEAYPSIADQLDKIYHSGVAGWKADIKVIKDANPKPE